MSVAALIELHEGRKSVPYPDSLGKLTCGVGHCLDTNPLPADILSEFAARGVDPRVGPWTDDLIDLVRDRDISAAVSEAQSYVGLPTWNALDPARTAALVDMAFELGFHGLSAFRQMRIAIQDSDWETGAAEALSSEWASQVPSRAKMDAAMLKTGEWPA